VLIATKRLRGARAVAMERARDQLLAGADSPVISTVAPELDSRRSREHLLHRGRLAEDLGEPGAFSSVPSSRMLSPTARRMRSTA